MESFIDVCSDKYIELSGVKDFKPVSTPFLPEPRETSPAGRFAFAGRVVESPWCRHAFPPDGHECVQTLVSL
eukprot:6825142-Lingulodinium_polyedra.AAC.1